MQSWTPLRHTWAIGAWPSVTRSERTARWVHTTQTRRAKTAWDELQEVAEDEAGVRSGKQHKSSAHRDALTRPSRGQEGRTKFSDTLTRPPILLDNDLKNKLNRRRIERQHIPSDLFVGANKRKRNENLRLAPFSTLFAENAYAQALATPVRMDCFSMARMPKSCMVGFYLTTVEGDKADLYSLLPLSVAAALVSKNKNRAKLTGNEKIAVEADEQDGLSWAAQGVASHVIGKRAAMEVISSNPRNVKKLAVSRRILNAHGNIKIDWRRDMPEYLLDGLRRVVAKKLRSLLMLKQGNLTQLSGNIAMIPGGGDTLERLDHVDHVACVLRLHSKPPLAEDVRADKAFNLQTSATVATGRGQTTPAFERNDGSGEGMVAGNGSTDENLTKDASPKEASVELTDSNLFRSALGQDADPCSLMDSMLEDQRTESGGATKRKKGLAWTNKAQQHRKRMGYWREQEPVHAQILKPLPPPEACSMTYFPTVPYRNRRIPAYSLPYLLGSELLVKVLDGASAKDCVYLTVGSSQGTVALQIWLMKLLAYVSDGKNPDLLI